MHKRALACLLAAALSLISPPAAPAALGQSGCAAPAVAPDLGGPAALPPSTATVGLHYVDSLGGDTRAAAGVGSSVVLFSRGADLLALSSPSRSLGRLHLPDAIEDIAMGGSAIYVAAGAGGLQVISGSGLRPLDALRTPGLAAAVALDGPRAYLAAAGPDGGLQVIDVASPARPRLLSSAPTYGSASGLAVAGGLAYVAGGLGGGLQIFDVTNPLSPTLRGGLITPGTARGVAVSGGRAYLAGGVCGMQVLDVADPARPRLLGAVATGGEAQAVQIAGGKAYVAAGSAGLLAFALGDGPPRQIAARSFGPLAPIGDVFLSGSFAHLAAGPAGTITIDIGTPALSEASSFGTLGGVRAALPGDGGRLYLALGDGGLAATDRAAILQATPSRRGSAGVALGLARGPDVGGAPTLYGAAGNDGLRVYRDQPGQGPLPAATIRLPGSVGALLVAGDTAYAAAGRAGLHILSLTNPLSPTLLRTIDTPGAALGLALDGGLAYVADRDGLRVIDPVAGAIVGGYSAPAGSFVQAVAVAGGRAYLADSRGLLVLDLGDPASPRPLGRADGFSAYDVALEAGRAYVAAGNDGVLAFDLGDPARPQLVGRYDSPGSALGVELAGGLIYVADNAGGALLLRAVSQPYRQWLPLIAGYGMLSAI